MAMVWKVLTRKKVIDPRSAEDTRLSRVLNTFDLTALGVGSTLGVGVYVLVGHVAKDIAGPAVILSFLLAAIASVFAGLCYAEFGARAPRAGSAYIYSYVCVGEFVAFIIGWNLILEYVIGSASVARGLSLYLDTLINDTLQNTFTEIAPIDVPYLSKYFDFFAFGISILLATALAFGLKESTLVNNIFTVLNIFVVLFVVIAGSINADPANWSISKDHNVTNGTVIGNGGFFPFGVEGMIKGAATCFYGFVGFDCIATTGEEVKNPKRAIPISIILSLGIIFLAYFGTSTVVTLMVPYYAQDPDAPIPSAFDHIGWEAAKWIVSIGGIFGLCASLFGAMFPLPRIVYAMANDSLVFKFLGTVHRRFQTPVVGTLLAGLLTGLMAALFELSQLVNMMSIGTLLAYTMVAASVLLLRYTRDEAPQYIPVQTSSDSDDSENYTENKTYNLNDSTNSDEQELLQYSGGSVLGQIFNCRRFKTPTKISEMIVTVEVFIYCIMCIFMGLSAIYLKDYISGGEVWAIVLTSVVVFIAVFVVMSMVTQPTSNKELSFKVPLVPLIPALSILVNIYLMLMLDTHTWIRFGVWMAIGLPIYYFSVRPYTEAQNKNVSNKNSIDYNATLPKHNGKLNGINNKAFMDEEISSPQLSLESEGKKRRAPPPPKPVDTSSDNEIPPEITKLDEILDEAANSIDRNAIERKLSADTVSNVSDIMSREENVVAVVHRDNVVTPAISKAPSFSSDRKISVSGNNENFIESNNIVSPSPDEVVPPLENENITPSDVIVQSEIQKQAPVVNENEISVYSEESPEKKSLDTESYGDGHSASTKNLSTDHSSEASPIPTPPPSPTSPVLNKKDNSSPLPPPIPSTTLSKDDLPMVIRPTTSNLKSVTLRPTKRREDARKVEQYEPGDANLKVGSSEYKNFLENLQGKLEMGSLVPTFVPFVKSPRESESKPVVEKEEEDRPPNENVIEDKIDKLDAMVKLGSFISDPVRNKGILGNINNFQNSDNKQSDEENTQSDDELNVGENQQKLSTDEDRILDKPQEEKKTNGTSDSDFQEHKGRMQNVFRSMNLKKVDSFKDSSPELRNIKTLGHSFLNDDKSKHRQAMGEIFKSIELMRKDSPKTADNE